MADSFVGVTPWPFDCARDGVVTGTAAINPLKIKLPQIVRILMFVSTSDAPEPYNFPSDCIRRKALGHDPINGISFDRAA